MEIATLVVPINNQLDFGKSSIFTSKRTDPFTNFKVFFWGKMQLLILEFHAVRFEFQCILLYCFIEWAAGTWSV